MNKLLQLTATSLLVSLVSLSQPLLADISSYLVAEKPSSNFLILTGEGDSTDSQASTSSKEVLRFTLQHRFNGGEPLAKETVEIPFDKLGDNPLIFLETLKQNFSKHLEKQKKPVEVDTELEFLLSAEVTQVLGNIPAIFIKTKVEENGAGKSDLVFPAYRRELPGKSGKGLIDWKGLKAQFTFTENFKNLTTALNIAGFMLEIPDEKVTASLGETSIKAAFDANLMPTEVDFDLSLFKMGEMGSGKELGALSLQNLTTLFNIQTTSKGLDLTQLKFNVGHFDFVEEGSQANLDGLALALAAKEENGVINYSLQTQIDKLEPPTEITMGEKLAINWIGKIDFTRLDADALLALQTTARQLQSKNDPMMFMALLGQFMQVAPKLVAKSPGIALTQLTVKTPKGNLEGTLDISLDGKKVTAFEIPVIIQAVLAKAKFTISKPLLEYVLTGVINNDMRQQIKRLSDKELSDADLAKLQEEAKKASKQQISMFMMMKLLSDAGDNYQLVADFKDSKLILNGQSIPLPFGGYQKVPAK